MSSESCQILHDALWFTSLAAFACGWGCWAAWGEGFYAGRSRARRDKSGLDRKDFIRALTKRLEIQADGGDSPEAFVKWAVEESLKEAQSHEREQHEQ